MEVEGLVVGYGRRRVSEGIDLRVEAGTVVLITGHNGTGKTTLLKTLFGLLNPLSGGGHVLEGTVGSTAPRDLIRRGGRYLGQGVRGFPGLTVGTSRRVLNGLYGMAPPSTPLASALPSTRLVGRLSVGQRRLEAIDILRAGQAVLFLLDEPLSGVDEQAGQRIASWVEAEKQRGTAFVIVEHRLDGFAGVVDRTLELRTLIEPTP